MDGKTPETATNRGHARCVARKTSKNSPRTYGTGALRLRRSAVSEWRYRCPKGHASWTNDRCKGYFCQACGGMFDELVDIKQPAAHHIDDPEVTVV